MKRIRVQVLVSAGGIADIDQRRGLWSRGEFMRQALKLAREQNLRGPTQLPEEPDPADEIEF